MKKIILLSATASSLLLATVGDLMIGEGPKATGMGSVSMAVSHGSESLYANPAMIKDVKTSEFSGYVTMFEPDVNFRSSAGGVNAAYSKSDADQSFIPGFAYAHRSSENIVWGISLAGTAGMGTDYKNAPSTAGAFQMQTELAIAKLSIPVAYTTGDLTVALAPVLQYSTLEINYNNGTGLSSNKSDSSVGLGMTAGFAYELGNLTVGGVYKSEIEANYKNNISSALTAFGMTSVLSGDQLDQPEEIGIGVAYIMNNNTFAIDFKRVNWAEVTGYKDFGWENQNVIAVGYQYATPMWALRAGYNYGKSPIAEQDGSTADGAKVNFFNLDGFPAMVEEHYTLGGDYTVSKSVAISLAAVYTPEAKESFSTAGFLGAGTTAEVKHSQQAITLGATYKF